MRLTIVTIVLCFVQLACQETRKKNNVGLANFGFGCVGRFELHPFKLQSRLKTRMSHFADGSGLMLDCKIRLFGIDKLAGLEITFLYITSGHTSQT